MSARLAPKRNLSEPRFAGIPKGSEFWTRIKTARDRFAERYGDAGKLPYDYQREPSDAILESVLLNQGKAIPVEFSRQAGKTEAVTMTALFLMALYPSLKNQGLPLFPSFNVGFFAPQAEQAKTDFDRLKSALPLLEAEWGIRGGEANGNTIRFSNGSTAFCFSLSPTSHPESKTLHLIVLEEAQDLIDQRIKKVAQPMGANTNATEVWIGTAGYHRCDFYDKVQGHGGSKPFVNPAKKVIAEKRRRYEETGDPLELAYEKKFNEAVKTQGLHSDEIRTQYLLEWVLERGQFITLEQLQALEGDYEQTLASDAPCVAGVDFGKVMDSTVATVLGEDYRVIAWLELQGDDYESQYLALRAFFQAFPRLKRIACDATATQDMMVDRMRATMRQDVVGIVMTAQEQDQLYKELAAVMVTPGATIRFPKGESLEKEKCFRQFLDLGKEVKNNRWVCKAPEGKGYHEDYCDSLALAVGALNQPGPQLLGGFGREEL